MQDSKSKGMISDIYFQNILGQELKLLLTNYTAAKLPQLQLSIQRALSKPSKMAGDLGVMYDIFARIEEQGLVVKSSIYDYMTALGHLEHYAKFDFDATGKSLFRTELGNAIETSSKERLLSGSALDKAVLSLGEKAFTPRNLYQAVVGNGFSCSVLLSKFGNTIKKYSLGN